MRFAKAVFLTAGVYGILVLAPMLFLEEQIGRDLPPPITHPDYFYGFVCLALVFQILFVLIAREPARYRLMMIPAMLEKFSYALAVGLLYRQGRAPAVTLGFAMVDLTLGVLFALAFWKTKQEASRS